MVEAALEDSLILILLPDGEDIREATETGCKQKMARSTKEILKLAGNINLDW